VVVRVSEASARSNEMESLSLALSREECSYIVHNSAVKKIQLTILPLFLVHRYW